MEKLRAAIQPEKFTTIKLSKSTLEFLRFDAEIETKKKLPYVISRIDQKGIKLSGFMDVLKIRASEGKISFPNRQSWDTFFSDAKHMNQMKPGERPDTVHLQGLPCRWFGHMEDDTHQPSEFVLSKVFSCFGEIRCVDIPCLDIYRKQMSAQISGVSTFSFDEENVFEAYVQFKDYIGFDKCMNAWHGKKLVFSCDKAWSTNIKVDFDKSKHLSDFAIKKRAAEREKLMSIQRDREEKVRKHKQVENMKLEAERRQQAEEKATQRKASSSKKPEKELRRKQRELKRRLKKMRSMGGEENKVDESKLNKKIAIEERKLLIAQRRLESIRLLDELFARIKVYQRKEIISLRKKKGESKENNLSEEVKSNKMEMISKWFNNECRKAINIRNYFRKKFESMPSNDEAKNQYEKARVNAKNILKTTKKAYMEDSENQEEEKEEDTTGNDMVVQEKKMRGKLVNSLIEQQKEAMFNHQKRVERVVRGEVLNPSKKKGGADSDSSSSGISLSCSSLSSIDDDIDTSVLPTAGENNDKVAVPNPPSWSQEQSESNQDGPGQWGAPPPPYGPMVPNRPPVFQGPGYPGYDEFANRGRGFYNRGFPRPYVPPPRSYMDSSGRGCYPYNNMNMRGMIPVGRFMNPWGIPMIEDEVNAKWKRIAEELEASKSREHSRSYSRSKSKSRSRARRRRLRSYSRHRSRSSRSHSRRCSRSRSSSQSKSRSRSRSRSKSSSRSRSARTKDESNSKCSSSSKSKSKTKSPKDRSKSPKSESPVAQITSESVDNNENELVKIRNKPSLNGLKEEALSEEKSRSRSKSRSWSKSTSRSKSSSSSSRSRSRSESRYRKTRRSRSRSRFRKRRSMSRSRSRSSSRSRSRSHSRKRMPTRKIKEMMKAMLASRKFSMNGERSFPPTFFSKYNSSDQYDFFRGRGRGCGPGDAWQKHNRAWQHRGGWTDSHKWDKKEEYKSKEQKRRFEIMSKVSKLKVTLDSESDKEEKKISIVYEEEKRDKRRRYSDKDMRDSISDHSQNSIRTTRDRYGYNNYNDRPNRAPRYRDRSFSPPVMRRNYDLSPGRYDLPSRRPDFSHRRPRSRSPPPRERREYRDGFRGKSKRRRRPSYNSDLSDVETRLKPKYCSSSPNEKNHVPLYDLETRYREEEERTRAQFDQTSKRGKLGHLRKNIRKRTADSDENSLTSFKGSESPPKIKVKKKKVNVDRKK